jgi:hypothetical protein
MINTTLEQSIVKTIAYFDLFDFPLSCLELWQNLYGPPENIGFDYFVDVLETSSYLKAKIDFYRGLYFLKSRHEIVNKRLRNYRIAEHKYKIALRRIKLFSLLPFVRAIFVCNNLGYSNSSEKSDVDIFVVTDNKKIWSCRFFLVGLATIFGFRPNSQTIKDKICLSFFVDSNFLNLSEDAEPDDIHFHYWINQFVPIYDPQNFYQSFFQANKWTEKYLPNRIKYTTTDRRVIQLNYFLKPLKNFFEILFSLSLFEKILRWWQLRIMPKKIRELANQSTDVIINDRQLKFHPNDRRVFYKEKFLAKIRDLAI